MKIQKLSQGILALSVLAGLMTACSNQPLPLASSLTADGMNANTLQDIFSILANDSGDNTKTTTDATNTDSTTDSNGDSSSDTSSSTATLQSRWEQFKAENPELATQLEALKDLTPAELKAKIQELRQSNPELFTGLHQSSACGCPGHMGPGGQPGQGRPGFGRPGMTTMPQMAPPMAPPMPSGQFARGSFQQGPMMAPPNSVIIINTGGAPAPAMRPGMNATMARPGFQPGFQAGRSGQGQWKQGPWQQGDAATQTDHFAEQHPELAAALAEMKDLSPEERRSKIEALRKDHPEYFEGLPTPPENWAGRQAGFQPGFGHRFGKNFNPGNQDSSQSNDQTSDSQN